MPSATFQMVDEWMNYVATKKVDCTTTTGDVFKVCLTNSTPTKAGTQVLADITALSGNGSDTQSITHTFAETAGASGIWRFSIGTDFTWTGSGAGFGPFRYVVLYDDTPAATPTDPIVGFWDYGSTITTVAAGETFKLDVDANFAVFTLTVS